MPTSFRRARSGSLCFAFAVALILLTPEMRVDAADTIALRGGKIITLAGNPIENGIVLVRDGKIEAVGADIAIPIDARVLDTTGKVIMPGFVEAHTSEGMGQANERNDNVPFLSVEDGIDPSLDYFEESRRNGITTAAIVPGNNTFIGGRAVILKTAGQYLNDMIMKRDAGMKISLKPASGSRMAHLARLRRELDQARAASEKRKSGEELKPAAEPASSEPKAEEGTTPAGGSEANAPATGSETPPAESANNAKSIDAMIAVVEGKLPVFLYCDTAMDVLSGKQLVDEYHLKAIFILGQDTHKAAKILADRRQPVVLDRNLIFWETNPRTLEDEKVVLPKVFREAGVPFVFQTGDGSLRTTNGSSFLWYQAAVAIRNGTPESDALRSLTLTSAELLGVQDFVGSIEVGKDADLVILSGEPLRLATWVEKTMVNGKIVYDRETDEKLQRLLSPKAD